MSDQPTHDWSRWDDVLLPQVLTPRARILIDGRSGSGKSTLATRLVELAAGAGVDVRCIRLDDIYPGWGGLAAAAQVVSDDLLRPLHERGRGTWQQHDWQNARPGPIHVVEAEQAIVVEGIGALSRESAPFATYRVVVTADAEVRRQQALSRDGDLYRPHWDEWAAQEELFIAHHQPHTLADLVIDTTAFREHA